MKLSLLLLLAIAAALAATASPDYFAAFENEDALEAASSGNQHGILPGGMITVDFRGKVGTLLPRGLAAPPDGLSAATDRAVLEGLLNAPMSYWHGKAMDQVRLLQHTQVYRRSYYDSEMGKGQLPLPPDSVWNVTVDPRSRGFQLVERHGLWFVMVEYGFESVLLARRGTMALADPAFANINGTVSESRLLPLDPDYVFQRTGYACVDETKLPHAVPSSSNIGHFFDGTCTATPTSYDASESSCHIRHTSALSCGDALRANTGTTTVQLKWKRVEYDPVVAAKFRVGSPETQRTRDLVHRPVDTFRFKYVYIPKGDCLLAQRSCVRNYGWRRLLMFTSALVNIGPERRLNIARLGDGSLANGTVFVEKGVYTWNQCVGDFRFNRFGRYSVDGRILNRPIATCLHDMKRYQNNEYSPLATPYDTCEWQGISSGWGFELVAGTPCQWLDLTRQRPWKKRQAKSELNPRGYICEGNPQLTARAKRPLFPSNGAPFAGRPLCNYTKGFMDNNQAEFRLPKPIGQFSAVTRRCGRGRREHGLARDCGWTVAYDAIECNPGAVVRLGVRHSKTELGLLPTLAARICESSRGLNGRSTQCEFADALASATVKPGMESVMTFTCPSARDDVETGGLVSVLVAKFAPWESRGEVKANVVVGWK